MKITRRKRKKPKRKACSLCAPEFMHGRPHPVAVQTRKLRKALHTADPGASHPPREYFDDKEGYWEFQECVDFGLNSYDFDPVELFNLRLAADVDAIKKKVRAKKLEL